MWITATALVCFPSLLKLSSSPIPPPHLLIMPGPLLNYLHGNNQVQKDHALSHSHKRFSRLWSGITLGLESLSGFMLLLRGTICIQQPSGPMGPGCYSSTQPTHYPVPWGDLPSIPLSGDSRGCTPAVSLTSNRETFL